MNKNQARSRLRLIRRRDRIRKGEPIRRTFAQPTATVDDAEGRDFDTTDPDLVGVTD